jgi:hypothetical protein|tara:strand:- start:4501 stop:5343 length:843 start_codon:yes stop_codon:yes gene_type:complete
MAQPSSRSELITYVKRRLGAPVLEINVADEQIEDIIDDAVQFYQERHSDGVIQTYMKYKITQDDIDRGRAGGSGGVGIASTSATESIAGSNVTFTWYENSNFIKVPNSIIGINKLFRLNGSSTIGSSLFNIKYQIFLNDIYYFDSMELLTYDMVKSKMEDIDFLLNPLKQIRFNQRQDRLYIDMDWTEVSVDDYIIIDCYRALDPSSFSQVWNDSFLKQYVAALVKKQWGQNLIKFQGVKLPGGVELNGRQIYDDGEKELRELMDKMSSYYELPPLDMIG